MMQTQRGIFAKPGTWCAMAVVASALVGFWNAEEIDKSFGDPVLRTVETKQPVSDTSTEKLISDEDYEKIEATLAQAGCPGWMVLASEGQSVLTPVESYSSEQVPSNAKVVPSDVKQVSARVPSVEYPVPVRVAQRNQPRRTNIALRPGFVATSIASPEDDPDDLLDGVADLVAEPEETPSDPEEAPVESESIETDQSQEILDSTESSESDGASESEEQVEEQPAEEQPAEDQAPEQQTVEEVQPVEEEEEPFRPIEQYTPPLVVEPTPEQSPIEEPAPQEVPLFLPDPLMPSPEPGIQSEPQLELEPQPVELSIPPQQEQLIIEPKVRQDLVPPPPTPRSTADPVEIKTPDPEPKQSPFSPPPVPKTQAPHATATEKPKTEQKTYCEYIADERYPSAEACAKCHKQVYDEWRISSHAYAAISPMFHKFEQKINDLSQGTIGYFCYRCHVPVGTNLGISRAAPLWDYPKVVREGVTCVACHRINERFGKTNGERRIEPGSIHAPVYGSIGGSGVAEAIGRKDHFKVKTSPHDKGPGQDIHVAGYRFDQLGKSEFCTSCHQVAVHPGIKLEVVWEQYRASPACKKGVSCQDCHMGRLPGVPSGYEGGAAAKVGDKVVNSNRKHSNHIFYGPGYSIAHPGIFPHNTDADRWSMKEWLLFDWRAGWGTEEFEELVENNQIYVQFPPVWAEVDDRMDAREIIEDNLEKLNEKKICRQQLMENGSHVDGPFFDSSLCRGNDLKFHYVITNTNEGHNLPSGSLGAQPQLWANVVLIGPRGQRLWESGYTDRWGDVADIHSVDVRNKRIPFDTQLFNLQTMFLITGAKGTDREFFLPVNIDFDQLPYLRPGAQPTSVINHPPFIRMEGRSIPPLGSRRVPYKVPAHLIREPGRYRLSFRLRSRAEPIYFMRFCDATKEMQRAMNEWMIDFHQSSVEFYVR